MAEKYSDVTAFAQPSSEQSSSHDSLNEYPRTVAVVVTYNREDLLPKTLAGIASGERVPAAVVIVDNASTDGTAEYLRALDYELPVDCIRLESNMGRRWRFRGGY